MHAVYKKSWELYQAWEYQASSSRSGTKHSQMLEKIWFVHRAGVGQERGNTLFKVIKNWRIFLISCWFMLVGCNLRNPFLTMTWKTPEFFIPRDGFYIVPSNLELFKDDNSEETESGASADYQTSPIQPKSIYTWERSNQKDHFNQSRYWWQTHWASVGYA